MASSYKVFFGGSPTSPFLPNSALTDITASPGTYTSPLNLYNTYRIEITDDGAPYYAVQGSTNGLYSNLYRATLTISGQITAQLNLSKTYTRKIYSFSSLVDRDNYINNQPSQPLPGGWPTDAVPGGVLVATFIFVIPAANQQSIVGDLEIQGNTFTMPPGLDNLNANLSSDISRLSLLTAQTNQGIDTLKNLTNLTQEKYLDETKDFLGNSIASLGKFYPNVTTVYNDLTSAINTVNTYGTNYNSTLFSNLATVISQIEKITSNSSFNINFNYESLYSKTNAAITLISTITPVLNSALDKKLKKTITTLGNSANVNSTMTEINVFVNTGKFLSDENPNSQYSLQANNLLQSIRLDSVSLYNSTQLFNDLNNISSNISILLKTI